MTETEDRSAIAAYRERQARRERISTAVLGSLACFAASQYDRREYAPHFASMVSSAVNLADALIAELDK